MMKPEDAFTILQAADRIGKGLIVPLVTPFTADGQAVDFAALRRLVEFLIRSGVHGLVPCGTTGELALLDSREKRQIVEAVIEDAAGRVPVIAQTGSITTAETIALTRHAQACGAAGVTVVTPYYYRLTDEALVAHYSAVADSVPGLPVFLYNIPAKTGNSLSPAVVAQIAQRCANVVGIKDSSGELANLALMRMAVNRRFYTLVGSDSLILAGMANGADGAIAGNANAIPEPFVAMFAALAEGDWAKARLLQDQITSATRILGNGSDLSLFKGVLKRRGLPVGPVRRPLLTATPGETERCARELEAIGLSLSRIT